MTDTIETAAGTADPEHVEAFVAAGALRDPRWASRSSSEAYTRLILGLAATRPHELLLSSEETARARALVAQSLGTENAAVLGLFEMAPDPTGAAAATHAIERAVAWAHARGLTMLYAPVDLNTWFDYRFMLPPERAAAGVPIRPWEPIHPPAYLELFRARGFTEVERYETTAILLPRTGAYTGASAVEQTRDAWRKAVDSGITFDRLTDPAALPPLLDELYPLCMEAFSENLLFEPLPASVFRSLHVSGIASRDASATHWARDEQGRPVGFVFAFREDDTMVVKTIAVDPGLRGRRLSSALMHLVIRTAVESGIHDFVSALVRRGNTSNFLAQAHLLPGVGCWKHEYVLLGRQSRQ